MIEPDWPALLVGHEALRIDAQGGVDRRAEIRGLVAWRHGKGANPIRLADDLAAPHSRSSKDRGKSRRPVVAAIRIEELSPHVASQLRGATELPGQDHQRLLQQTL